MNSKLNVIGAIFGMTAIVLGAFGAHALKNILNIQQLATFETGVKYQMYHALFLLLIATNQNIYEKTKKYIFNLVVLGTIFFSGSLYLLATNPLTNFDFKKFGFITPIGGLLLISAWGLFFASFLKKKI